MEVNKFLFEASQKSGASGYEDEISNLVKEVFSPFVDDIKRDKLGNLITLKKGSINSPRRLKIMMAAHMDEIGLMVTKIDKNGFLRFANIGGIDYRVLLSQEVLIGENKVYGVIGMMSTHMQSEEDRKKSIKTEEMFIDTGLCKEEVEKKIKVGDHIIIKRAPIEILNECLSGKSLDDRAGVAVMLQCLKELTTLKHHADVYAVATVQEEVGLRGAMVSSYSINPDIGIAIDVCHGDMPGVPEEETCKLSKGPVISIGPNFHPWLNKKLIEVAEENNIPYQINSTPGASGTDAWAIQITKVGIPTVLISIPLRYMHTSVETLSIKDIKTAGKLLSRFILSLNTIEKEVLTCF